MGATILVFAECRDGEFKRSSHEAIGVARRLADGFGGSVGVVVVGARAAAAAPGLAAYGADRILACAEESLDLYQAQAYAATLAAAADQESAQLVVVAASSMGKDVAARLAARLGAASACDLIELEWSPDAGLVGLPPGAATRSPPGASTRRTGWSRSPSGRYRAGREGSAATMARARCPG